MDKLKEQVNVLRAIALLRPNAHLAFLYHDAYNKLYNNHGQLEEFMRSMFTCYYKKKIIRGDYITRIYYLYPRYSWIPYRIQFNSYISNTCKSFVASTIGGGWKLKTEAWEYLAKHDLIIKKGCLKEYVKNGANRLTGDCYLCNKSTLSGKSYIMECVCGAIYVHSECLRYNNFCQICKEIFKKRHYVDTDSDAFLRRQTFIYLDLYGEY